MILGLRQYMQESSDCVGVDLRLKADCRKENYSN